MAAKEAQSELWTLAAGWSGVKEIAGMGILLIGVSGGAPNLEFPQNFWLSYLVINSGPTDTLE
jgi:hypothetical protein